MVGPCPSCSGFSGCSKVPGIVRWTALHGRDAASGYVGACSARTRRAWCRTPGSVRCGRWPGTRVWLRVTPTLCPAPARACRPMGRGRVFSDLAVAVGRWRGRDQRHRCAGRSRGAVRSGGPAADHVVDPGPGRPVPRDKPFPDSGHHRSAGRQAGSRGPLWGCRLPAVLGRVPFARPSPARPGVSAGDATASDRLRHRGTSCMSPIVRRPLQRPRAASFPSPGCRPVRRPA